MKNNTQLPPLTAQGMFLQAKVITIHKWYVFKACATAGHPWIGIKHDLSKFSPSEFFELSRGQGWNISPVQVIKDIQGYSHAWQHHKGHNPHHWEYWTDKYRADGVKTLKIPFRYLLELFCDYIGAGMSYSRGDWTPEGAQEYWFGLRDKYSTIHPDSVAMINIWFEDLVNLGYKRTLRNLDAYKDFYENDIGKTEVLD